MKMLSGKMDDYLVLAQAEAKEYLSDQSHSKACNNITCCSSACNKKYNGTTLKR